jgi:hypothetical protein
MVPSPGPRPNQPPRMKDSVAISILKVSPDAGSMKRLMRRGQAEARGGGEPDHPDKAHARHVEQRAPHQRDQHGLAEVGLHHQKRDHSDEQHQRKSIGRHFRTLRRFTEQPGDQDHESGLQKLRGLDVHPQDHQPAPRAFDLGAEVRRDGDQRETDDKDDDRDLADFARRQKRRRDQDTGGGDEEKHLAVDEVKWVQPDAGGNRRARRQAQHDAAQHQCAERRQCQPVDRPPPFGKRRRLRPRGHGPSRREVPA